MGRLLLRFSDWLIGLIDRNATYSDQMKGRLSGAQSTEWERGYFTKDRTDLPPSPTRETAWQRMLRERGFRRR